MNLHSISNKNKTADIVNKLNISLSLIRIMEKFKHLKVVADGGSLKSNCISIEKPTIWC